MTISAILAKQPGPVHTATADEPVDAVVARLTALRIGAVPVVAGDRVIGIFSERDLVHHLARLGAPALAQTIGTVMTSPVVGIEPSASVLSALSLMTKRRFRHLPVIESDRLIGFVSIGDLVKFRIEAIEAEAAAMRDYIAGS